MDTRKLLITLFVFISLNSVAVPPKAAVAEPVFDAPQALSPGEPATWGELRVEKNASGSNTIRWTTLEEKGSEHFLVQRADDGIHFRVVAHIAARGNSREEVRYSFDDKKGGTASYRILVVNEAGKAGYSRIVQ